MSIGPVSSNKITCKRCGTCCKKGGPTLHTKDASLVRHQRLSVASLVTFRRGELAYHPTELRLIELHTDMIKIKGKNHSFECLFYEEAEGMCSIYEDRPLECRTLECWNPGPLMDMFLKDLLVRKDIFSKSLYEVIDEYDTKFQPSRLLELLKQGDKLGVARLEELDQEYRESLITSGIALEGEMDALLGRPLTLLRRAFESIL